MTNKKHNYGKSEMSPIQIVWTMVANGHTQKDIGIYTTNFGQWCDVHNILDAIEQGLKDCPF